MLLKCFAIIALIGLTPFLSSATENTIFGMLVEAGCGSHLGDKNPSDEHIACMVRCASKGDPIGILTDEGLYTITGPWLDTNRNQLSELMAEEVIATGQTSATGDRLLIEITTIELAE
tara:strand:- start:6131 stop:6484 length:354 start_codon:yes stop_codon:yes gene_type:complete